MFHILVKFTAIQTQSGPINFASAVVFVVVLLEASKDR